MKNIWHKTKLLKLVVEYVLDNADYNPSYEEFCFCLENEKDEILKNADFIYKQVS